MVKLKERINKLKKDRNQIRYADVKLKFQKNSQSEEESLSVRILSNIYLLYLYM